MLFMRFAFHLLCVFFFFFKQKTAYEMRISDWSSDVCSSDLRLEARDLLARDIDDRLIEQSQLVFRQRVAQRIFDRLALARLIVHRVGIEAIEIGRASGRERVCQYV